MTAPKAQAANKPLNQPKPNMRQGTINRPATMH